MAGRARGGAQAMYIHITADLLELTEVSSGGDSFLFDFGARAGQDPYTSLSGTYGSILFNMAAVGLV